MDLFAKPMPVKGPMFVWSIKFGLYGSEPYQAYVTASSKEEARRILEKEAAQELKNLRWVQQPTITITKTCIQPNTLT